MRTALTVLALWFCSFTTLYAQYYEIQQHELDSAYLDREIEDLENSSLSPNYLSRAEKVKYIGEKLKYHKAVKTASQLIVTFHRKNNDVDGELRTHLQLLNYLSVNKLRKDELITLISVGDLYAQYELHEKATETYSKAFDVATNLNDGKAQYQLWKKRGISYFKAKSFDKAIADFDKYIQYAREKNHTLDLIWGLQKQSDIAKQRKNYTTLLKFNLEILELAQKNQLTKEEVIALNNLGVSYKYTKKFKEATNLFNSIINDSKTDLSVKACAQQNLGVIAQNQSQYELAVKSFKNAVSSYKKLGDFKNEGINLDFLALVYYQSGDSYNALEYNKQCLNIASSKNLPLLKQDGYYTRSLIHQGLYEFENALDYYKKYLSLKDSLEMLSYKKQQGILQQQYFLERQESALELHYISEEIKNIEIAKLKAEAEAYVEKAKAEAEKLKAYQADSMLQKEQIINQRLQIRQIENMLKLKEEQERVRKRENKIKLLDAEQKKKDLELTNERLLREKDQTKAKAKLEQQKAFNRNLLYLLFTLILILFIIFLAYRQVRKKKKHISAQNIIIERERDKSDKLLLNILPPEVAQELKDKGQTSPRYYEDASVVFTDFAGFTMISERLSPEELVNTLDKVFLEFDLITEKYGMSRIKTIGDAYMCVAGIPNQDDFHAENAVNAALEMRDFIADFNNALPPNSPTWNIRIGVNSGSLVAGVVGVRKFAYDIWGDAVNIASRMESSGELSKVNISSSTYEKVKGKFRTEHRGKVYAKNKGDIDMYFVEN